MKLPIPHDAMPFGPEDPGPWRWHPASREQLRRVAMALFLLSLGVLFVASLVAYIVIRTAGPSLTSQGLTILPRGLWVSTVVLIFSGVFMFLAQRHAAVTRAATPRHLHDVTFWITLAWVTSVGFLVVQTPSIRYLVVQHELSAIARSGGAHGVIYALILLHAVHVVGGLVPLTMLMWRGLSGRMKSENLGAVRSCATYWHFLEVVWLTMFATFVIVG